MSQNLKLGQYKSLNANARIFEIGSAEKYMNFLKLFKPFYIDKYFPKLEEDYAKRELGKPPSLISNFVCLKFELNSDCRA